ncbi:hypothetical protein [Streptomyces fagopyri]|uniref:hypothetical protein n=1 Tax=Streptomyces fagopyri TaxID=2662397 RepID=UPI003717F1BA
MGNRAATPEVLSRHGPDGGRRGHPARDRCRSHSCAPDRSCSAHALAFPLAPAVPFAFAAPVAFAFAFAAPVAFAFASASAFPFAFAFAFAFASAWRSARDSRQTC